MGSNRQFIRVLSGAILFFYVVLTPSADDLSLAGGRDTNVRAVHDLVADKAEGGHHGTADNANRWIGAGIAEPVLLKRRLTTGARRRRSKTSAAHAGHYPV
jgi:hypothetical protein